VAEAAVAAMAEAAPAEAAPVGLPEAAKTKQSQAAEKA
jgi:hypothetical protein